MRPRSLALRLRTLTDGLPGAIFGGLVYGLWVVWANRAGGLDLALRSGAAHWLTSVGLTYFGTAAMRSCFGLLPQPDLGALLAFVGGLLLTYTVLLMVHFSIGTPNIPLTLAAGVVPNLLFCSGYALLLRRTTAPLADAALPVVTA